METPYSKIISTMRKQGAYSNGYDMAVCSVISIDPVAINYEEVLIDHNTYCNPGWIDPEDPLEEILAGEEFLSPGFKTYLSELNRKLKIQPGDLVAVQRVGNSFLILGKVVMM